MDITTLLWFAILMLIMFILGWYFARQDVKQQLIQYQNLPKQYVQGLNHLLNQNSEEALSALMDIAQADPNAIELHFALGKMFRRQGDFNLAVKVHRYIYSRQDSSQAQIQQALYALGQDYYKAGMYDRAEQSFISLLNTDYQVESAKYLMQIANWEQNWLKAHQYLMYLPKQGYTAMHLQLNVLEDAKQNTAIKETILKTLQTQYEEVSVHPRYQLFNIALQLKNLNAETCTDYTVQKVNTLLQNTSLNIKEFIDKNPSMYAHVYALMQTNQQKQWFLLTLMADVIKQSTLDLLHELILPYSQHLQACITEQTDFNSNSKQAFSLLNDLLVGALNTLSALDSNPQKKHLSTVKRTFVYFLLQQQAFIQTVQTMYTQIIDDMPALNTQMLLHYSTLALKQQQTQPQYLCQACGFKTQAFYWNCPACREWDSLHSLAN